MPCDSNLNPEAAYYQMESPPCYTIATGLPTYDEALHHNQQHFAFGMKFIYPTLAAVHHQASNLISSWEKYDISSKDQKLATATLKCKSSTTNNNNSSSNKKSSSQSSSSPSLEASTATSATSSLLMPPPSYEATTTVTCDNVAITMPQLDSCESAKISSDLTDIITV